MFCLEEKGFKCLIHEVLAFQSFVPLVLQPLPRNECTNYPKFFLKISLSNFEQCVKNKGLEGAAGAVVWRGARGALFTPAPAPLLIGREGGAADSVCVSCAPAVSWCPLSARTLLYCTLLLLGRRAVHELSRSVLYTFHSKCISNMGYQFKVFRQDSSL